MTNMYVLYKTVSNADTEWGFFLVINCQSGIIPAVFCSYILDYVDCIKKVMFETQQEDLEKVYKFYCSKKPQPLNTQFPDHVGKEEAVKKFIDRCEKNNTTELSPPSKKIVLYFFCFWGSENNTQYLITFLFFVC